MEKRKIGIKKILGRYLIVPDRGKPLVFNPKKDVKVNVRKIQDNYIATTPQGNWIIMDQKSYDEYKQGDLRTELKKALEKRGILVSEQNVLGVVSDGIIRKKGIFDGPSLHIITPTNRCNQKCVYCHSSPCGEEDYEQDMNLKTALRTVDFILQTPKKKITIEFQGGESTLNQEVMKEIVRYSKEQNVGLGKNIIYVLATNLTNMNEELAGYIAKENIIISTSLDGPKDIHDHNRKMEGGGSSYDTVTSWISKLRKKGVRVGALMVTTKQSLGRHEDIIDEYVKQELYTIQIKPISKLGFASKTWDKIGYNIEEFNKFYRDCLMYMLKLRKKGIKMKERHAEVALKKIIDKKDPNFTEMRSPCGAITGQLTYDHKGNIYSCDEGRCFEEFKLGNVHEDDMGDVLKNKKAQEIINSSVLEKKDGCSSCAYLPFCGTCPVLNHANHGSINIEPKGTDRCKFYQALFDLMFEGLIKGKEK